MDRKQIALEVIAEVAGVEISKLTPETELVAQLGIDSPKALQMLFQLEDRFGIEIDDEDLEGLTTVGNVLDTIDRYERAAQAEAT